MIRYPEEIKMDHINRRIAEKSIANETRKYLETKIAQLEEKIFNHVIHEKDWQIEMERESHYGKRNTIS